MQAVKMRNSQLRTKLLCSLLLASAMTLYMSETLVQAAEIGTVRDGDRTFAEDTTIVADDGNFEGKTNLITIIGNSKAQGMTVTANQGVQITGRADTADASGKVIGILSDIDAGALSVNGNYHLTLNGDHIDAIKNYSGNDLNLNGSFTIIGNSNITDEAMFADEVVMGIGVTKNKGSNILISGDKLEMVFNLHNGVFIGVNNHTNQYKEIAFDSKETIIKLVQTGKADYTMGVSGHESITNFNGNTLIDLYSPNTVDMIYGISTNGDLGNAYDTTVNFNGRTTNIKAVGTGTYGVLAVLASGAPCSINFTGSDVALAASNIGVYKAAAITAQYGANVTSAANTNITVDVKSNSGVAYGVYNSVYTEANGNINLQGSLTGTVSSTAGDAIGIGNALSTAVTSAKDGTTRIGKALNLTVNAEKGAAKGIYSKTQYSHVISEGDVRITAAGKAASYAVHAVDSGNVVLGSLGKTVHLTGDVVAESSGEITLAGSSNTVRGTLQANNAKIILQGADAAIHTIDRLATTANGIIQVSGGKLDINDLHGNIGTNEKYDLAAKSLVLNNKGILVGNATNLFEEQQPGVGLQIFNDISAVVDFAGGKLAVGDATYTLQDSQRYNAALKRATVDGGGTTLIMTGTLAGGSSEIGVADLAVTGAVHTNVTAQSSDNTLVIGNSGTPVQGTAVDNDFGAKELHIGDGNSAAGITVDNNKELTLVGDGSGSIIKNKDGAEHTNQATVALDNGGALNLGSAAATNSGGTLHATVEVKHADSKLHVEAGRFAVSEITATQGTVAVNSGAALQTDSLKLGENNTDATLAVNGALVANTLETTANSTITVGKENAAGSLQVADAKLNGAAVVLDPIWKDNNTIGHASKAAMVFANNKVDGKFTVGMNSVLTLGSIDTAKAEAVFNDSGLSWGKDNISAALYLDKAQTLDTTGGIVVDGTKQSATAIANQMQFAKGSLLMMDASIMHNHAVAISATNSTLTVENDAGLYIANAVAGEQYTVLSGATDGSSVVNGWKDKNLLLNKLVKGDVSFIGGVITVTTTHVKAANSMPGAYIPNILDHMIQDTNSANAGIKYLSTVIADTYGGVAASTTAVNNFASRAERVGAGYNSIMAAMSLGSNIQEHASITNTNRAAGGIWAEYAHHKSSVGDFGAASFESQYNGIVVGVDFKQVGKYYSGIAFSYGDGSSTDSIGNDKYTSWGISYYGGLKNDNSNLMFDLGYSHTKHDIKGVVDTEPANRILTLGIKGEKLYANAHGTKYVPYTGLRYLNIGSESYDGKIGAQTAVSYNSRSANVWLLPLGIKISHESTNRSGWTWRPYADLSYVFVMGDKRSAMTVTVPGVDAMDTVGYQLMDSGFFSGRLGIEAGRSNMSYGIGYSYQKSSHTKNNRFFTNITFRF